MPIELSSTMKQFLADQLGGELVEYQSTIALTRGQHQVRIEFTELPAWERRLGVRLYCLLDRVETQSHPESSRPSLRGLPSLLFRRRTTEDLKYRRWGLTREVQTGDPEFDTYVYVDTDAPNTHLDTLLGSEDTRRRVMSLLKNHCVSIEINRSRAELRVMYGAHEPNPASLAQLAEEIHWVLQETLALKSALPVFEGNTHVAQRFRRVSWAYRFLWILMLSGIVFAIGTTIFGWIPVDDRFLHYIGGIGFGSAVLFVPLSYLIARGHSRGKSHFVGLSVLGFVAFPFGTLGLLVGTNAFLDMSTPRVYRVDVVVVPDCSRSRRSIQLRDWRDSQKTFYKQLSPRLCRATKRGDQFELTVKKGFWGFPFCQNYRRLK